MPSIIRQPRRPRSISDPGRAFRAAARVMLTVVMLAALIGCGDGGPGRKTPDDVLRTATIMVERGRARELSTLFHADNEDMKKVLHNMGVLFGNLQKLGNAVTDEFPREVASLRESMEDAAKSGKATSLLSQIASSQSRGSRRAARDPEKWRKEQAQREKQFGDAMNALFADPYGFLERSAGRLSTVPITDDTAAILWDSKPVLAPVGMVMKRDASTGDWAIVLPLNIPGLANFMPQTSQEYKVFAALVAIINNVIVDLAKDVREKRITTMSDLSRKAGEKAFMPAAMGYVAYSKLIEDRRKKAAPATPTAPSR
jgi:hypothetical protein